MRNNLADEGASWLGTYSTGDNTNHPFGLSSAILSALYWQARTIQVVCEISYNNGAGSPQTMTADFTVYEDAGSGARAPRFRATQEDWINETKTETSGSPPNEEERTITLGMIAVPATETVVVDGGSYYPYFFVEFTAENEDAELVSFRSNNSAHPDTGDTGSFSSSSHSGGLGGSGSYQLYQQAPTPIEITGTSCSVSVTQWYT